MEPKDRAERDYYLGYAVLKLIFGEKFALGAVRLFIYFQILLMLALVFRPETRGFGIVVLGWLIIQAFIHVLENINL